MPTLAELKSLREGITVDEIRMKAEYIKDCDWWRVISGDVLYADGLDEGTAHLIASAPSILDLAISLLEEREALRGKIEGMRPVAQYDERDRGWCEALDGFLDLLEDKEK